MTTTTTTTKRLGLILFHLVLVSLLASASACGGGDGGGGGDDDVIDAAPLPMADAMLPGDRTGIERCAAGAGGQLEQIWAVDNQHGPIKSMSLVGGSIIVVTSFDNSVKQWTIGGNPVSSPTYGQPFDQIGAVVNAVALSDDGERLIGGDVTGKAHMWFRADAFLAATVDASTAPLVAIALTADISRAAVADDTMGGNLRLWNLSDNTIGAAIPSTLWNATSLTFTSNALFMGGHNYGEPSIDRFDGAAPTMAGDTWVQHGVTGWVRAIAATPDGTRLVAAGDELVAVLSASDLNDAPLYTTATGHMAVGVAVTPTGDYFATAGSEGTLRLWNGATATEVVSVTVPGPVGVAIDATGERLITASSDGHVQGYRCK